MRAYIPDYELTTPASLAETLALLAREPGVWKPFAGGTDLMVLLEAGKLPHSNYINIWKLDELRSVERLILMCKPTKFCAQSFPCSARLPVRQAV